MKKHIKQNDKKANRFNVPFENYQLGLEFSEKAKEEILYISSVEKTPPSEDIKT